MRTDREILTTLKNPSATIDELRTAEEELWLRYKMMVNKNWNILANQLDHSAAVLDAEDDFRSEAFFAMKKAVAAINLDKIRDDNWKFLGYYRLYLKTVRGQFIKNIKRAHKQERSLYAPALKGSGEILITDNDQSLIEDSASMDPLQVALHNESETQVNAAIAACLVKWDSKRKQIFEMRERGMSKGAIAKLYEVHPATITHYLNSMRMDLEQLMY
jgi:hypothetical protein